MKYIVYITINNVAKINGLNRIFIGVHKTENPEYFDGYLGDGVVIQQPNTFMYPKTPFQAAVKKYGTESFTRITVGVYDNATEAYEKQNQLLDMNVMKQSHIYNFYLGTNRAIYQFNLEGKVVKKWDCIDDACDFYGYPKTRFKFAAKHKYPFLNYLWSFKNNIDVTQYQNKSINKILHVYDSCGKQIKEFITFRGCAEYLEIDESLIPNAIKHQLLINNKYYVSDSLSDEFIPKPRRQYNKATFYVYNSDGTFLGSAVGKKVMPIIGQHSWRVISNSFKLRNGWYKDFYLSLKPIDKIPEKFVSNKQVDVYTKYGEFIETLDSLRQVKDKYNVPASALKKIEHGNKYYEDYIFKYHSK